jgi:DNA-binding LytR/AlgR family response regulator
MHPIKIAIVEDEAIIASLLHKNLEKLGYQIVGSAVNYNEAVKLLRENCPDIIFLDIQLSSKKDGIDLAEYIRKHHNMPIIFLTANSDKNTIERAKKINPEAFLIKPFTTENLYAAVEIALSNYDKAGWQKYSEPSSIIFKQGYEFIKVALNEIIFFESESNYLNVYTTDEKHISIRSTASEIIKRLPANKFCRINRACIVNMSFIEEVQKNNILLQDLSLKLSTNYKQELLKKLAQQS